MRRALAVLSFAIFAAPFAHAATSDADERKPPPPQPRSSSGATLDRERDYTRGRDYSRERYYERERTEERRDARDERKKSTPPTERRY